MPKTPQKKHGDYSNRINKIKGVSSININCSKEQKVLIRAK
jgi:hypothetical protein